MGFPMHQPNFARRLGHGRHPVAQGLVGVGRISGQAVDGGFGRGAAFKDSPARGPGGLVSHKEQVAFGSSRPCFKWLTMRPPVHMPDPAMMMAVPVRHRSRRWSWNRSTAYRCSNLMGWSPAAFRVSASRSQQSSMSWQSRVISIPNGESMNTGTPGLMRSSS